MYRATVELVRLKPDATTRISVLARDAVAEFTPTYGLRDAMRIVVAIPARIRWSSGRASTRSSHVGSFFRDADLFETLAQRVLPRLFHRNADGDVRVWVAGCTTGEDAYSVAMLLCERAAGMPHAPLLQVF